VDDDPDILLLTRLVLEDSFPSVKVRTATNGPEGLAALAADPPHVILSDYRMPRMDGIEFLQRAAQEAPGAHRILMTAQVDPALPERARQAGAVFIAKGLHPGELVAAVGRAMAEPRRQLK
jgi:CheY-like chemotaxis protein